MIDLSLEFSKILDIDNNYNYVIVRHNSDTKCGCWRALSDSPDPLCPNCEGGGWIFNEWIEKCKLFYATLFRPVAHSHDFDYGKTYTQNFTIYMKGEERNRSIKLNDIIFDIQTTKTGVVIDPIKRIRKWQVMDQFDLKLDNNKTEFVKIFAKPLVV